MMIRSALMVAGDKQKHLDKISQLQCDIAILNLEDGVSDKQLARELLAKTLQNNSYENCKIVIRVNDLVESCGIEDIKALNKVKPDAIRIPKIRTKKDVQKALDLVDEDIEIHLSIETKEALHNLHELKLDKRVTTVYLGILDMLESLELSQSILTLDNPVIEYILSKFLIDSKIAGLYPISFTFQDYKDTQTFEQWCQKEKLMGFSGKSCISPTQVKIANDTFTFDPSLLEKAKYIVEVFEEQKKNGCTGFVDEQYGFIDEPIYKDALLVLKKHPF